MPSLLKIIITTFSDQEVATSVLQTLLKEKLAVCGTILPQAHSIYHWQGKIEEAEEVVVWIKTSQDLLVSCQNRLTLLHPYKIAELIVLEPLFVGEAYQRWIEETLAG
ncbi:MAG: divalent-cation tolerance protein CutA [Chthoniobacterales bacterium]|nr:divalent-cation tolerance protein CutA [Chthoniobacterales bacterium]